jgi:DNA-binding NarL/FixJ family response regulator
MIIAKKLNKPLGTVRIQVNKLLKKLDVKSTKEAICKINSYDM